jgi:SAM-dependent methyltransferase
MISGLVLAESEDGSHPKHRIMDYHEWFCCHLHQDWLVVDVGCGKGEMASDLARHCRSVVAIDLVAKNIEEAQRRRQAPNIQFVCGDALEFSFPNADVVVLSNVLEHLCSRVNFLRRLSQLAPRILVRVPLIDRDWLPLLLKERGLPWALDDTHEIEYTQALLEDELSEAGYEIVEIRIKYGELYVAASIFGQHSGWAA